MTDFTISYLSGLAAALTTSTLEAAGRRIRDEILGTEKEQAVRRCMQAGLTALVLAATDAAPEEEALLHDIFDRFVDDPDIGRELSPLLRGNPVDVDGLAYLFAAAGYDADTLPVLDFAEAMRAFEAAFLVHAETEPDLRETIKTAQLREQTQLQTQLLETVQEMSRRITGGGTPSIEAERIEAGTVVSGTQIIYQWRPGESDQDDERQARSLREAYLNRLYETTRHLYLGGIDPKAAGDSEAHMHLNAVYTALLTLTSEDHERMRDPYMVTRDKEPRRQSALAQLNRHDRLVLLGDPGSGKSTFVNFVAMCLAGDALGRTQANVELLTTPLPREDEDEEPSPQPWSHGALLPVRVVLRDFAARGLPEEAGTAATAEHLWSFIAAELQTANLGDYAEHLRRELLDEGGLLLLDGLDEVPEANQRREQIKQAVTDFIKTYSNCRVLVTSRTYAYQQQEWHLPDFEEAVLAPFTPAQIRAFVDRWYVHIADLRDMDTDDAQGRAELLKRAIFNSSRLQGLARRPLLLTLMASLHAWRGGSLPERREELYADAVDLLLDWWESQRVVRDAAGTVELIQPSLAEWLKVDREKVRELLNELAYEAHKTQPELVGTADVPEEGLITGLMRLSQNPDVKPQRLVEYLSHRAGLLVPRGVGVYTFPHRTFQEYLSACHLTGPDYPDELADLARADPNRWREVALLAGAKAARGVASAIWQLVEALCYRAPDAPDAGEEDAWGARLAGQALVESADLDEVSERHRSKVNRVRDWQVHIMRKSDLPALECAGAGRVLAQLGDPRPEVMTIEGMEFCHVPAGSFVMGSGDDDDVADDDEKPQQDYDIPYDYWIGRYPVTNAQFQVFVEAGGYAEARYWPEAKNAGRWEDGAVQSWRDNKPRREPYDYGEPFILPNHPVVGIMWYEALAFTRWLTEQMPGGWQARLPNEPEWEKAARGGKQVARMAVARSLNDLASDVQQVVDLQSNEQPARRYPWDGDPDSERANYEDTDLGTTSAASCFPQGSSFCGAEEMSGTVWEWLRSLHDEYPYPSDIETIQQRENLSAGDMTLRVLRGGAFNIAARLVRCAYRFRYGPYVGVDSIGFRVVAVPPAV